MSERVSQRIVLCEDESHSRLVSAYLRKCGLRYDPPYVNRVVASEMTQGGNIDYVLQEFPKQLHAVRNRAKLSKTQLIVMADADESRTVEERRRQFAHAAPYSDHDPIVLLIPKRHVETWFRSALGEDVDEAKDCKRPGKNRWKSEEVRHVADRIYDWARLPTRTELSCVASLMNSFDEWRKIG